MKRRIFITLLAPLLFVACQPDKRDEPQKEQSPDRPQKEQRWEDGPNDSNPKPPWPT